MTTNPMQIHLLVKKIKEHAKRKEVDDGDIVCGLAIYAKGYCKNTIVNNTNNSQRGHAKRLDLTEIFADWPQ